MVDVIPSKVRKTSLGWVGIGSASLLLMAGLLYSLPQTRATGDFVEYWAAGRLNAMGLNPYAANQLLSLQQSVGYAHAQPMMMWNPPHTLALVMPFGLMPYPIGRLAWLLLSFAVLLICALTLWHLYGGPAKDRWVAILLACAFVPTFFVVAGGQIGALILLGLVVFLWAERGKHWILAGTATPLIAIKPQLLYLFWIAWALWIIDQRRWRVLFGAILSMASLMLIALPFNPAVGEQYLAALRQPSYYWVTPTIGANLRLVLGWDKYWLQFVPQVLGAAWFVWYWARSRKAWQWDQQMPIVLIASILTTAFGWLFDEVVMLVVVLQMTAWLLHRRRMVVANVLAFVALDALIVATHFAPRLAAEWAASHGGDPTGDGFGLVTSILHPNRSWGVLVVAALALWYLLLRRLQMRDRREDEATR